MGYVTDYKGEAGPFDTEEAAEFFEFKLGKQVNGYHFDVSIGASMHDGYTVNFEVNDVKWYEWRNDLSELSRSFPNITVDLEGRGEEPGDLWKARFRNGDSEVVDAVFTFPDFTELTD